MAGFLSALGWAAPVIAGTSLTQQDYQNQQQRFATEQGFGNFLNTLGPDYEPFKQWYKQAGPGASQDIAAAMGKFGNLYRQDLQTGQLAGIWNDPNTSPEQKLAKAAAIDPEYGKYFGEMAVQQAKLGGGLNDTLSGISEVLNSGAYKLSPGDRALGEAAVRTRNAGLAEDFNKRILPKYAGTTGDVNAPFTEDELQARSAEDPKFGRVVQDYPTQARTMSKGKFLALAAKAETPSTAEKTTMDQQAQALDSLNVLLQMGEKALPHVDQATGSTPAMLGGVYRWIQEKRGIATYQNYEQAQTAIIPHLRALANTGRVNERELKLASDGLTGATSIEALRSAVAIAQSSIRRAYQRLKDQNLAITGIDNEGKKNEIIHLGPATGGPAPDFGDGGAPAGDSEDDIIERSRGD